MYKIIGSVKSRTFRVLWMLEEMGLTYQICGLPLMLGVAAFMVALSAIMVGLLKPVLSDKFEHP